MSQKLSDRFSDIMGSPAARNEAKAILREANRNEWTCDFTVIGDVGLVSGATVDHTGYGVGDGRYLLESTTHDLSAAGYTVKYSGHRALKGY